MTEQQTRDGQAEPASDIASEDHVSLRVRLTNATCEALDRLNVFLGYHQRFSPNPDSIILIPKGAKFEEYTSFHGGFHTMGAFSFSETFNLNAEIGRYCSVGPGFMVFGERHPIERVTSSSITYCFRPNWNKPQFVRAHRVLMGDAHQPDFDGFKPSPPPVVEHDVWIGQNVQSARGITIGTGSVVAAGSVVTKSVPPYAIVGGNPARLIRMRFPTALARRLLDSEWWRYHPDVLWKFDYRDPEGFCDRIEEAARNGEVAPYPFRTWTWCHLLAAIADAHASS